MKEEEFIIGKWYKYDNWYIKHSHFDGDTQVCSEEIRPIGQHSVCVGRFGGPETFHEKYLLEDLSEIQEYLPDNHPDKFPKEILLTNIL